MMALLVRTCSCALHFADLLLGQEQSRLAPHVQRERPRRRPPCLGTAE